MPTIKHARNLALLACGAALLMPLYGCVPLVVGGAASTTAMVATDRRSAGAQLDDQTIELKASNDMRNLFGDKARVNAMSYNGWVLLTGDVPTEQDKQKAEDAASKIPKVTKVINALRVGDITPISVRSNDTWITSKVKAALIDTKNVPSRTIKILTERGVVYLMGIVTNDEAERAAIAAASVSGVNKVVKLFKIVSAASLQPNSTSAQDNSGSASSSTTTPAATSGSVQAMPVK
jgi:osmotically-inducible protein OsmY